jgi:uncharacterized protein YdaU (DUF1376 family)
MKRPWMPLYVADYRAKTTHLGAVEHGIYLLLIMHYWQEGGLPNDDRLLARIACATDTEWRRSKPIIEAFFEPGWKHGRIEEELAKAADISSKRRASAEAMHSKRHASAPANAHASASHTSHFTHHQSQEVKNFSGIVEKKANGWSPPRHGATGKGRVYIEFGTAEWSQYAEDYRGVHGEDPRPNDHGGKWFKTLGERAA